MVNYRRAKQCLIKWYAVKNFRDFINKLIEIFHLIIVSMIPFVANAVFSCCFAIKCLLLANQSLIIKNTMNIITIL